MQEQELNGSFISSSLATTPKKRNFIENLIINSKKATIQLY